jgi:beta-galactosidase
VKRALGVCYYPEHWPEEMWEEDARRMVASGLTWVRIGEFAWSPMEPKEGHYTFDWLDRAISVLSDAGLKIVLCTPSATPPRWMVHRFPEMLAVDENGQPRKFGSRRHYCHSHAGYRDAAADMAARLGKRYGRDPRIAAWQIDNEYGCHDTVISYSDAARDAFRIWLAERYGDVETLNTAWGNIFWSMICDSFDDIDLPDRTVTQPNPAHELAFRRFSSDQVVAWNAAQVAALRPHTDAPLIHNYMGRELAFDHFKLARDLDIASWDSYPIGFLSDRLEADAAHKQRYLMQGDPDMQAFHHDLYRSMNRGRWWVMEQQPGPVNWAPYNPAPLPGMVRLWSWEAFAHGAEVVSYFRWRQAPFAQEQMHAGLRRVDDAPAPGLAEAEQVAQEIRQMPDVSQVQAPVALILDYASAWAWDVLPQGADFDYFRLVFDTYKALRRRGLSIDILPAETADLSGYKLVCAPGIATLPDALRNAFGQTKATCLIGPRTDQINADLCLKTPLGPDLPGCEISVTRVESLPPNVARPVRGGGNIRHWMESVTSDALKVIETTDGTGVLFQHQNLRYLAGWPDATLWDRITDMLAADAGIELFNLPEGLRLRDTAEHTFAFNYDIQAREWNGAVIPPAGVIWWPKQE